MKELIDFNEYIEQVLDALQSAHSILFHFDLDCGGDNPEATQALGQYKATRDTVEAMREPLVPQIEATMKMEQEMEQFFNTN